jgi:hypothetical protein
MVENEICVTDSRCPLLDPDPPIACYMDSSEWRVKRWDISLAPIFGGRGRSSTLCESSREQIDPRLCSGARNWHFLEGVLSIVYDLPGRRNDKNAEQACVRSFYGGLDHRDPIAVG